MDLTFLYFEFDREFLLLASGEGCLMVSTCWVFPKVESQFAFGELALTSSPLLGRRPIWDLLSLLRLLARAIGDFCPETELRFWVRKPDFLASSIACENAAPPCDWVSTRDIFFLRELVCVYCCIEDSPCEVMALIINCAFEDIPRLTLEK